MSNFTKLILLLFLLITNFPAEAQLTADFTTTTSTSGCSPLLVQFKDKSTGSITSYSWDLGNGTTSTKQNPSTTYDSSGTYTVTLTISDGTTKSTKTYTNYITVYATPTVDFSAIPTSGCPGTTVSFHDKSTLNAPGSGTYVWNFGDVTSSTLQNPSKKYYTSGYYNIALQVTNSKSCQATLVKDSFIHIFYPPSALFSASNTHFCTLPGHAVFINLTSGTMPIKYLWNFGDGPATDTATNPSHDYTAHGSFDVTLIATDSNGCSDTITNKSFINTKVLTGSFTAPDSACLGDTVTFINASSGAGLSFKWLFGDGKTSTIVSAPHIYTSAGTYTVSLITYDGYCYDTVTRSITINPPPSISFTTSPAIPCPAPIAITFNNTTTGGSTYKWNFGDGSTSTATNPIHTYAKTTSYDVALYVTSRYGCSDSLKLKNAVVIDALYNHIATLHANGCIPFVDSFFDVTSQNRLGYAPAYPATTASHAWDFGDGTTSSAAAPHHTYTKYGTYIVRDTITTSNGCMAIDSIIVKVGTPPVASFTSPATICIDATINFNNTSTGATDYQWIFGDGGTDTTKSPAYKFDDSSSKDTVTLVALNNGCPDTTFKRLYVRSPDADFLPVHDCSNPYHLSFQNQSVAPTSIEWYFGDGDSSSVYEPDHTYKTYGNYTVKLVAVNDTTGCVDSISSVVTLADTLIPSFVANDTAVCKNDIITLTASVANGASNGYIWQDNGSVPPGNGADTLSDTLRGSGYHTIDLTVLDQFGCAYTAEKKRYIIVGEPQAWLAGVPISGCRPLNITFYDSSIDVPGTTTTKRFWSFGDNDSTFGSTPITHLYDTSGIFNVKLVVTDNIGCMDSVTFVGYDTVYKPIIKIGTYNGTPCAGVSDQFYYTNETPNDTIKSFTWYFGDRTTSTVASPLHIYHDTGSYTVMLITKDFHGCIDTVVAPDLVYISEPHASFTMDDSVKICPTLIVNFTNTSVGAANYLWQMGDGNSGTSTDASNSYTKSGYYTVKLIAYDYNGCADTAIGHVNVFGYDGGLTYTPLKGCAPLTVTFKSSISGAPTALWDFSDGETTSDTNSSTTSSITHVYTDPGSYVPKLILGDGKGCESSSRGLDTIKVDGVIAKYVPYPACEKDTVHFIDSSKSFFSPILTWQWTFYDGSTSTNQDPIMYFDSTGVYPVTFIVTNENGCTDTLSNNVTIYPPPVVTAGADTVICAGDAATLTPGGASSYVWSPGATLSCTTCPSPQATPAVPTTYTVVGTDIHGCMNSDTVTVSLKTVATGAIDSNGNVCKGQATQLHAYGAQQYVWIPATGLNNNKIADPMASPDTTTTYMIIASEGSCMPDTIYATVTVHPIPSISAGNDQTMVSGESVQLIASGANVLNYLWSPAASLSCSTCSNPTANPPATTIYTVTGYSDFGCVDSAKVTVHVICDKSQVFIPNSFTPNGDGMNDVFYPRGTGISKIKSFMIYNRWGEQVFEHSNFDINDESGGWNGSYKGAPPKPDVYVYVMVAVCESGEEITWKGDVTIIR